MTDNLIARIATRKSKLALWQAETVKDLLIGGGWHASLVPIVTSGDKLQRGPLADIRLRDAGLPESLTTGKGLFVKEIQESLLASESDCAVHSMKDLPVETSSGLCVSGILPRAGVRDVLILNPAIATEINKSLKSSEPLAGLAFGKFREALLKSESFLEGRIGTTSLRRQMLLKKHLSQQLKPEILRGNVDSRLARVKEGEFAAIILAEAGLQRLRLFEKDFMIALPEDLFIPAPAQGIIAIETNDSNKTLNDFLSRTSHGQTVMSAALERLVLWILGGDCHTALGVHWDGNSKISIICGNENGERSSAFQLSAQDLLTLQSAVQRMPTFSNYFEFVKNHPVRARLEKHFSEIGYHEVAPVRY